MTWLAVNKNGDEIISPDKPTRWGGEWADMEEVWVESERGQIDMAFMLHKGGSSKIFLASCFAFDTAIFSSIKNNV